MNQGWTTEASILQDPSVQPRTTGTLSPGNGVLPSSITVLTPYKGQLLELRRWFSGLPGVDLQTVDRFQGDENDIILLSLVRTQALTEFIRRQDRMVVALSRARFAMYIFGNARLLEKEDMPHWQRTMKLLGQGWEGNPKPRLGPALPICCPRHPQVQQSALPGRPFPTHFCPHQCGEFFDGCDDESHVCPKTCHAGSHEKCPFPCSRPLDCGHPCKRKCWQECECLVREDVDVGCSHEVHPPRPCSHPCPYPWEDLMEVVPGDPVLAIALTLGGGGWHPPCVHGTPLGAVFLPGR